jgi:hypothetical protein
MMVRDATSGRTLTISTTALVHVELPAACASANSKDNCFGKPDADKDRPDNPSAQAGKQRT